MNVRLGGGGGEQATQRSASGVELDHTAIFRTAVRRVE